MGITQRELYLVSLGPVCKPDMVTWFFCFMEQKKDPWDVKEMETTAIHPGTGATTQVENGDFGMSSRFLGHHPITLPPTNQKKVTYPVALSPNFAYITLFVFIIISLSCSSLNGVEKAHSPYLSVSLVFSFSTQL